MLYQFRDHNQNFPSSDNYIRDRVGLKSYKNARVLIYLRHTSQHPGENPGLPI